MQFQIALSALLLVSLFALPAAAIEVTETEESKKHRLTAKSKQTQGLNASTGQATQKCSKAESTFDREDTPENYYKEISNTSF